MPGFTPQLTFGNWSEGIYDNSFAPFATIQPATSQTAVLLGTSAFDLGAVAAGSTSAAIPALSERAVLFVLWGTTVSAAPTSVTFGGNAATALSTSLNGGGGGNGSSVAMYIVDISAFAGTSQTLAVNFAGAPTGHVGVFVHYLQGYNYTTGSWSFSSMATNAVVATNAITATGNGLLLTAAMQRNTASSAWTLAEATAIYSITQGGAGFTLDEALATNSLGARTGYVNRPPAGASSVTLSVFSNRNALASAFIPEA